MDEHDVHPRVADVPPANEVHEDGDVPAHGDREQDAVRGDGEDVPVVKRHVDRQTPGIERGPLDEAGVQLAVVGLISGAGR